MKLVVDELSESAFACLKRSERAIIEVRAQYPLITSSNIVAFAIISHAVFLNNSRIIIIVDITAESKYCSRAGLTATLHTAETDN